MVLFYDPKCENCRSLAPEYTKAALLLKSKGLDYVALAKVDAILEDVLSNHYDVQGLSALIIIRVPYHIILR